MLAAIFVSTIKEQLFEFVNFLDRWDLFSHCLFCCCSCFLFQIDPPMTGRVFSNTIAVRGQLLFDNVEE